MIGGPDTFTHSSPGWAPCSGMLSRLCFSILKARKTPNLGMSVPTSQVVSCSENWDIAKNGTQMEIKRVT